MKKKVPAKKVVAKKTLKISNKKKGHKKPVVKKNKITKVYVAFVLDKSSSMSLVQDETISTFNEQVDTINNKSKKVKTSVSLFAFNHNVEQIFFNEPVKTLTKLNRDTYSPNGSTAMYDGVGDTIKALETLKDINKKNVAALVLIMSDGQENSSRKFKQNDIAEVIQRLQATKRWTFTYLGANQDLSQISKNLFIPLQNTMSFDATKSGVITASNLTRGAVGTYYDVVESGATSTQSFYVPTENKDKDKDNK